MGLDFTNIKDTEGAAVYVIHNGTTQSQATMERLVTEIKAGTNKQVLLFSARDGNGAKIINFYQLTGSEFVIIVRDDDQLHHVWSGGERFDASMITYYANQVG
jgi:hypothetical protein